MGGGSALPPLPPHALEGGNLDSPILIYFRRGLMGEPRFPHAKISKITLIILTNFAFISHTF